MAVTVRIGDAELVGLQDREHTFDRSWHFPSVPDEAWEQYAELLTVDTYGVLNFGAFLLRAEGRSVLVDTGWGPEMGPPGAPATAARLLDELASVGIGVEDVDVVAFTHLHPDHVGWNLVRDGDRLAPRFPNARYLVPELDWAHYRGREDIHPNIIAQALPLGDLEVTELIADGHAVLPSLTAVATPGHTPGHTSYLLSSDGEHGFILGDLAHHPVILNEVAWVQRFDWDPERAVLTRKETFERLEREGWLVAAGHFRAPGLGRLVRRDGRRDWEPV